MLRSTLLSLSAAVALAACAAPQTQTFVRPDPKAPSAFPSHQNAGFSVAPANAPSGPAVDEFAANFLNGVQARSFSGKREFCGYFFVDSSGQLRGTPPRAGTTASCNMPAPRPGQGIIASYHTHGSFTRRYDNEVPSIVDLQSDFDFGIDGYVSTPGGRVWLVDFQTKSTRQVCGLRCISSDPHFIPQDEEGIRQTYTIPQLQRRSSGF